ncbi:MAG: pyridoxal-phosphate dependent enzyme [Thermomicrobiales bacterium]|nr:pyridoxal-phosphate dependent enzyme [Thermomicrobiales bacterium]MCO5220327.1 pyridoxal-phosphate dependent enzyme [Thermomicrobiales bacterium]
MMETTQTEIPIGLSEIEQARELLANGPNGSIATRTPLIPSDPLSSQLGCRVWLKLENLQKTGSYKIRGAYTNIASLTPEQASAGIVTASAGNHAQGVALAASLFGIADRTTVFVPVGTPRVKQENTRSYGVEVREVGENFDRARDAAYEEAAETGRIFVEPFDDWNTIAGQGTIGLEMLDELPAANAILAPVGGGGLIAGIALAVEGRGAQARVIGVEAEGAACLVWALEHGVPDAMPHPPRTQIADGIKVSRIGERPFLVASTLIGRDQVITVPDTEIVAAIADLMVYAKIIAEGAGATALAGLRDIQRGRVPSIPPFGKDDNVIVLISGGNIDPSFSWRILYEQSVPNLLVIRIAMPDRPGELLRMLLPIAHLNVNIIDVDVNRLDARPRMGERIVELCVAISAQAQADNLLSALRSKGYNVLVSRWQDPRLDRNAMLSRSLLTADRNFDATPREQSDA